MIGSKVLLKHVMCWQMELPISGKADARAKCSSSIKNHNVCDMLCHWESRCCITDFIKWFLMLQNQGMCDRLYVKKPRC